VKSKKKKEGRRSPHLNMKDISIENASKTFVNKISRSVLEKFHMSPQKTNLLNLQMGKLFPHSKIFYKENKLRLRIPRRKLRCNGMRNLIGDEDNCTCIFSEERKTRNGSLLTSEEQDEWANLHEHIMNKVKNLIDENKEAFMSARKLRNKINSGIERFRSLDSSKRKEYTSKLIGQFKSQYKNGFIDFLSPTNTSQMSDKYLGDGLKKNYLTVKIPKASLINRSPLFI
jgi:hypothetical protein